MERVCASCGVVLGLNRSKVCRDCKQKRGFIEKEKAKHERMAENHRAGLILVHSCISDPRNKSEYVCRCRRWVSRAIAAEMCGAGETVDYETRNEFFFGKGRDVLTTRKRLKAPRTRTITKTEIENSIGDLQRRRIAELPLEIREEVEEMLTVPRTILLHPPTIVQSHLETAWHSHSDKAQEERDRIEVYDELTQEMWRSLIRIVPAEEYDRIEALHRGVPVVWSGIGCDDRTLGGVGIDVSNERLDDPEELTADSEEDEDAPTDSEDQETAEVRESADDPDAEVISIDRDEEVSLEGRSEEIEEDIEAA